MVHESTYDAIFFGNERTDKQGNSRRRMVKKAMNNKMGVAEAAYEVGYVSASQFSREFKRLFGVPPKSSII